MNRALYGTLRDGRPVHAYTLRNTAGLAAHVLDMGGTVTAIEVPLKAGGSRNVVLGLADLAAYEAKAWFNCLIGRYANRLKNGFRLDGKHYTLAADENGVTLHGGRPHSWGIRIWEVTDATDSSLALRLLSPDGDQGFPGNLTVDVSYTVTDANELRLDYRATTDAPTVVNLTNHIYFNLAGHGSAEGQLLQIESDAITATDADQVPTGEMMPVDGTAFDFRQPTALGARIRAHERQLCIARGYDHNYVLRKSKPGALDRAVTFSDRATGPGRVTLTLSTTEPGIQVYSTNNVNGSMISAAGEMIRMGDALALETQHFPDSPNHAAFPSTVLRPGEVFTSTTVFRFEG
jgi:aldose 1-epimerase